MIGDEELVSFSVPTLVSQEVWWSGAGGGRWRSGVPSLELLGSGPRCGLEAPEVDTGERGAQRSGARVQGFRGQPGCGGNRAPGPGAGAPDAPSPPGLRALRAPSPGRGSLTGPEPRRPGSPAGSVRPHPSGGAARGYRRGPWGGKRLIDPHPGLTFPHPPGTHPPRSRGAAP